MKNAVLFFCLTLLCSQTINAQLNHFEVAAVETDQNIDLDFTAGDTVKHQIYIDQSAPLKNQLLLFLPGTGGKPKDHYSKFCKMAAEEGYHVIGLVYKNTISMSDSCGSTADNGPNCSENARTEIIYGTPLSDQVTVDSSNSIINRLSKLLLHLNTQFPTKGWDHFIDQSSGNLKWNNVAVAGHSQGGGHAALLARDNTLARVLFFNSPSDQDLNLNTPLNQPTWLFEPRSTPDSAYYAFYHQQNGGDDRLAIYSTLGLDQFASAINVDLSIPPYNGSHILFTDSSTFNFGAFTLNSCDDSGQKPTFDPHSDIIVDCETPIKQDQSAAYEEVWRHMLSNHTSTLNSKNNFSSSSHISLYPNPTTGIVQLKGISEDFRITLISCDGKILLENSNSLTFDLKGMNSGYYYVRIVSESDILTKKILLL